MSREDIMREAAALRGVPYRIDPPPDGVNNLDCSLYVLKTFERAGHAFRGVRTAEQIRQACVPIADNQVQAGDLLFFEHTYEPSEAHGPDGRIASHIGISLGSGTHRMWDAHQSPSRDGVGLTDIGTSYWTDHWLEARRPRQLLATAPPATKPTGNMRSSVNGLRVRANPSLNAAIKGSLDNGAVVEADQYAWRHIRTGTLDGWVADEYLEDNK